MLSTIDIISMLILHIVIGSFAIYYFRHLENIRLVALVGLLWFPILLAIIIALLGCLLYDLLAALIYNKKPSVAVNLIYRISVL